MSEKSRFWLWLTRHRCRIRSVGRNLRHQQVLAARCSKCDWEHMCAIGPTSSYVDIVEYLKGRFAKVHPEPWRKEKGLASLSNVEVRG